MWYVLDWFWEKRKLAAVHSVVCIVFNKYIERYCNDLWKHVVVVVVVEAAVAAAAGCCSYRKDMQPVTKLIVNDFKLFLQTWYTVYVCVRSVIAHNLRRRELPPSVHIWRHFSTDRGCISQDHNAGLSSNIS